MPDIRIGMQAEMPKDDSKATASRLTRQLMLAVREGARLNVESLDIPFGDIHYSVDRFSVMVRLASRFASSLPALVRTDGKPIPVDVPVPPGGFSAASRLLDLWFRRDPEWLQHSLGLAVRQSGVQLRRLPTRILIDSFESALEAFLTARLRARQSSIAYSPGLKLQVTTSTHGLRVHYSPAYFFNAKSVLGSPTSPVIGWIQPGRYVFGVAGGPIGPSPVFDLNAEYDVPPTATLHIGQ